MKIKGKKEPLFLNRELSWLDFNHRVLECACDNSIPLLERLKFLAITGSNLDEFFMVRVGGLQILAQQSQIKKDISKKTPKEQLESIYKKTTKFVWEQSKCFIEIKKQLLKEGIEFKKSHELTNKQKQHAERIFETEIKPILNPIALQSGEKLPLLSNKVVYFAVRLTLPQEQKEIIPPNQKSQKRVVQKIIVFPFAGNLNRFISLPSDKGSCFILLEDLLELFLYQYFPKEQIKETCCFRITRNAEISVQEDDAHDLLMAMEDIIEERKRGHIVRLELGANASWVFETVLSGLLNLKQDSLFRINYPLDLSCFMQITRLSGYDNLKYKQFQTKISTELKTALVFDILNKKNVLLYHPYDSFDYVVRFIKECAKDPNVIAIKQTLYRTSRKSPIISALKEAAMAGKYVTALVELKARFEEEKNIEWAKELEDAGVTVIYGVKDLKTHAKIFIAIRREANQIKRYVHFGTGNYNEITAGIYSDVSFLTSEETICSDATTFFNSITGNTQPVGFQKIESAPYGLRNFVISLIQSEIQNSLEGKKAFIRAKMNSLTDPQIIKMLYQASLAGVKIQLNIRGICCLIPRVKNLSENITVKSIVGRFLEHARIWHFYNGGSNKVFISTADWMERNLDKRVELVVPIEDKKSKERLIQILDLCFKDVKNSWVLCEDGIWLRLKEKHKDKKEIDCHAEFLKESLKEIAKEKMRKRTIFEVHKPTKSKK